MPEAEFGPGAVVGWLRAHGTDDGLAGCAFLIAPQIVLTCAHVVGAHLGLPGAPVPAAVPEDEVTIRFEALQAEVTGRVVQGGWFSNARPLPGSISDIAVIRLDAPVRSISPLPAISQRMPTQSRLVLIHGAEADYKSFGQQVQGEMGGSNIPRGWRQIDPVNSSRGFTAKAGFSGSPVLDDLGNLIWGMVVAVAEQATGVVYAIPAGDLQTALKFANDTTLSHLKHTNNQQEDVSRIRLLEAVNAAERAAAIPMRGQDGGGNPDCDDPLGTKRIKEVAQLIDTIIALQALDPAAKLSTDELLSDHSSDSLINYARILASAAKSIHPLLGKDSYQGDSAMKHHSDGAYKAQRSLARAQEIYQAVLAISGHLARKDRNYSAWQSDLGVSYVIVNMIKA